MPPTPQETQHIDLVAHAPEAPRKKPSSGSGPIVGVVIIVFLLIIGALYFWGAQLNHQAEEPLPFIPGDSTTS